MSNKCQVNLSILVDHFSKAKANKEHIETVFSNVGFIGTFNVIFAFNIMNLMSTLSQMQNFNFI